MTTPTIGEKITCHDASCCAAGLKVGERYTVSGMFGDRVCLLEFPGESFFPWRFTAPTPEQTGGWVGFYEGRAWVFSTTYEGVYRLVRGTDCKQGALTVLRVREAEFRALLRVAIDHKIGPGVSRG